MIINCFTQISSSVVNTLNCTFFSCVEFSFLNNYYVQCIHWIAGRGCGSGSAFNFPPGSGFRKGNFSNKTEKWKEIGNNCEVIQFFSVNLHNFHCFYLWRIFYVFFNLRKLFLKPIRRGRTFLSPNFVKFGYVINSRKLKTLYFAEIFKNVLFS